jgi:hypothetical protein
MMWPAGDGNLEIALVAPDNAGAVSEPLCSVLSASW